MALSAAAAVAVPSLLAQPQAANRRLSSAENLVSQPLVTVHPRHNVALEAPTTRRNVGVRALFGWGKPKADPPSKSPSAKSPPAKGKVSRASCNKCRGTGGVDCPVCNGTGKSKTKGNMLERWKCYKCQGFGLVSCPNCGSAGLTPEQRGER